MEIIDRVKESIAEYLETNNVELVDITYRREQAGMVLRLLVDKPGGITIKECEELNNFLSTCLNREELIDEYYILEVSSPGLDRPIKTDRDFERSIGKALDVTTYGPIDSRKTHQGTLIGMDKENIVIESDGISTVIPKNSIAMARLRIEV